MVIDRVPLLDISPFLEGSESGKQDVARRIAEACESIGFFAITGHGVAAETVEALRRVSHDFFSRPVEEKLRAEHPVAGTPRGYRAFAGEALGRAGGGEAEPDLKEFYHVGSDDWPDDEYYVSQEGRRYFIPNLWPETPAGFREAALEYYRAMEVLEGHLLHASGIALGIGETFFDDKVDRHVSAMRINHYPAQATPPEAGQIRAGEHTDYGIMTILMGEDEPGSLQVRTRDGRWIDVETRPEFFVVNIGDLMMRWTNDVWLSNKHRVVNPPPDIASKVSRISIAFFHQPNYDAVIECIPTCAGPDRPALYPPVRSGDYRDIKYQETLVAGEVS